MRELRKETETNYIFDSFLRSINIIIRNERTPKGDGNSWILLLFYKRWRKKIRNERTPKGDGNFNSRSPLDNSIPFLIRNERTPKGDGNLYLFPNTVIISCFI